MRIASDIIKRNPFFRPRETPKPEDDEVDLSALAVRKELPIAECREEGFRTTSEFEREDAGAPPGSLFGYSKDAAAAYWEALDEEGSTE